MRGEPAIVGGRFRLQERVGAGAAAVVFRAVDVANELFAMASSVTRAYALRQRGAAEAESAGQLAELFCRGARRKVRRLFRDLWSNDDSFKYSVGKAVLEGEHLWLEDLLQGLHELHRPTLAADEEPAAEPALAKARAAAAAG